jgi:hypothetical protein
LCGCASIVPKNTPWKCELRPIVIVKNYRKSPTDDFWEEVISEIELAIYPITREK